MLIVDIFNDELVAVLVVDADDNGFDGRVTLDEDACANCYSLLLRTESTSYPTSCRSWHFEQNIVVALVDACLENRVIPRKDLVRVS